MAPQKVQGVTVTNPMTGTSLLVSWTASSSPVIGYSVYRALSSLGPFDLLQSGISVDFFMDITADQRQRTDYWYAVTATDLTGESLMSESANQIPFARISSAEELTRLGEQAEMNHRLILAEVVRRNEFLLRRGGEVVDIYIRKTAGTKCSNCYDPVRNQPKFPECPVCFGTTYEGGYESFNGVLAKIEPYRDNRELMEAGFKWRVTPRSWITTYPLVRPGDILVRHLNNRRYEMQNIDVKLSRGIITRQEFDIMEFQKTERPEIFALGAT